MHRMVVAWFAENGESEEVTERNDRVDVDNALGLTVFTLL